MPADNRDRDIIEHILRYCEQVEAAHTDFDGSQERFEEQPIRTLSPCASSR